MQDFSWRDRQIKHTPAFVKAVADERGINESTVQGLLNREFIGGVFVQKWNEPTVAFPIQDEHTGEIFRAHCRRWKDKDWVYEPYADPKVRGVTALVYGNFETATKIYLFESQWDAISLIDILNLFDEIDAGQVCLITTRGAQNAKKLGHFTWPENSSGKSIYTFGQNDDAGRRWLETVIEIVGGAYVVPTPVAYNDLGEWVKDGHATACDIENAIDHAELRRAKPTEDSGQEEPKEEVCPYPAVDWTNIETAQESRARFVQEVFYPEQSILKTYLDFARTVSESSDTHLLGAILPVVGALLARRVYVEWPQRNIYPNLFSLLVGPAGQRKSDAIKVASRIAWTCLPAAAFLKKHLSTEALFEEYCEESGGLPDKILLAEEANTIMASWTKTDYGARAAAEFLDLYDCALLSESFMRNKSKKNGSGRTIPETSTNVVMGGTFNVAMFPVEQIKQGIQRRFMFNVSEQMPRTIEWPESKSIIDLAHTFAPVLGFNGPIRMPRNGPVWAFWSNYQRQNSALLNQTGLDNDALSARLATTPTSMLKVAMIFEACIAAHRKLKNIPEVFSLESLQPAADYVDAHMKAAEFIDQHGLRKVAQELGEVVLAIVHSDFLPQRPDTIYVTRSQLTRRFCPNTRRQGAMTTDDLYQQIIPELERQGEVRRVVKEGRLEVYAFRV
jgi:hypothetical protein